MRTLTPYRGIGLFLVCLIAGCATSSEPLEVSYEASSNQTTYETKEMRLDGMQVTEGLERDNRFYVKITGSCMGQDCAPRKYTMRFIKEGPQSVTIEGRNVRLNVGTETITWTDPQNRDVNRTATVRSGTFTQIKLTSEQLTTVGSVRNVDGTVGGASFSIPHDTRAPIRKLLARLGREVDSSEEQSSS